MSRGLTFYARQLLAGEAALRKQLDAPLLIWELPTEGGEQVLLGTFSGYTKPRPTAREPLVYELKKGESRQNAFALGITVGRTENNDLVMDDNSVSRFHAYFQKDSKGRWTLVDAESKNGTVADGLRLKGSAPVELKSGSRIRFGSVDVRFLSPDDFVAFVKKKLAES